MQILPKIYENKNISTYTILFKISLVEISLALFMKIKVFVINIV